MSPSSPEHNEFETSGPSAFERDSHQPQILMCPPDHYGIEYEINPWMSRQRQADHAVAVRQWNDLRAIAARPPERGF